MHPQPPTKRKILLFNTKYTLFKATSQVKINKKYKSTTNIKFGDTHLILFKISPQLLFLIKFVRKMLTQLLMFFFYMLVRMHILILHTYRDITFDLLIILHFIYLFIF